MAGSSGFLSTCISMLDFIIWGATGFTGSLACASVAGVQSQFFSCTLPNGGKKRDCRCASKSRSHLSRWS
jgi:hypothetical protein